MTATNPPTPLLSARVPMPLDTVVHSDALTFLRGLPDNTVNCVVTSPPYFNLRVYSDNSREIGREETLPEYINNLVNLFREMRRVLTNDGNVFLNMGDTYVGGGRGANPPLSAYWKQGTNRGSLVPPTLPQSGFKPKDLMMVPHRLAIALQDDGWWVRQDNVWEKPNCMPESVTDRTTRSHEYIFHLTKSETYWYCADAIKEPAKEVSNERLLRGRSDHHKNVNGAPGQPNQGLNEPRPNVRKGGGDFSKRYADQQPNHGGESHRKIYEMVNKRSVWTITVKGFEGAHFATFPEEVPETCILAGCPIGGIVLDPFMGSGTTGLVARRLGRHYIGSELNAEYVALARERLATPYTLPMLEMLQVTA